MPLFLTQTRYYSGARMTGAGLALIFAAIGLAGCNPTVKVEAPDKPIVINLNIKIDQEVRVKVDKDVEILVNSNPNLF